MDLKWFHFTVLGKFALNVSCDFFFTYARSGGDVTSSNQTCHWAISAWQAGCFALRCQSMLWNHWNGMCCVGIKFPPISSFMTVWRVNLCFVNRFVSQLVRVVGSLKCVYARLVVEWMTKAKCSTIKWHKSLIALPKTIVGRWTSSWCRLGGPNLWPHFMSEATVDPCLGHQLLTPVSRHICTFHLFTRKYKSTMFKTIFPLIYSRLWFGSVELLK